MAAIAPSSRRLTRWLPRSLRGQFAAALGAIGTLVLAGGLTAVYALRTTAEQARQTSRERLELVESAQELQQRAQQIQLLSDRMVTAPTSQAARRQFEHIVAELDRLDRLTANLAASDDASVLDLHMASQLFRNSAHVISHLREDASAGGDTPQARAEAMATYREEMLAHATAMANAARTRSEHATKAYQAAVQHVVDASRTSTGWVVGWLAATLLGTWLIGRLLLGRQVLNRLQQVSQSLRQADASGATEHLTPARADDEIDEMARAVDHFLNDRAQLALTRARLEIEQQRLAAIIDNIADCIVVLHGGRVQEMNRAAEQMFGMKPAQAHGRRGDDLLVGLNWQASTLPGVTQDALARDMSGSTIPVEVTLSPVANAGDLIVLVIRDATVRREAQRHLVAARDAAEAARATQSAFLAAMSHELRTPLNGVLGYAQLLELDASLTEHQRFGAATIRRCGEHLLALINDLLDLAKRDAGKLELCITDVVLRDCLRLTCDIIRVKAEEAGLQFRVELGADLPVRVQADEKRLRQVLLNLLSNAVKFTDHGEIVLIVSRQSAMSVPIDTIRFEVRDSGIGMTKEQLDTLFLPFVQSGDARRRTVGTGLGLAISRELVRLMGGDIQVRSAPGGGTQFWFELSLPVSGARPRQPTPELITGYAGPRRRILVVDDLPANRVILHEWLAPLGFEIVEAEHGAQALERARAQPPDLVITDMLMPGMRGDELMARIHQVQALRSVPIIAMSAAIGESRLPVGAGHDACAFLPKPLEREQLLSEIGRQLALDWRREPPVNPGLTHESAARSHSHAAPRRE